MKDFLWRVKEARDRKRGIELALKKFLAGTALIAAAVICAGWYDGEQQYVEEVYVVQEGDTLWDIASRYMDKNSGGRRYILEFMYGIIENNEALQDSNGGFIEPGQEIVITYWVRKESN